MFENVFVISLAFKRDRREKFLKSYPKCLPEPVIFTAIHGDTVQHPDWWTSGRGAWGCMRSHLAILEDCFNKGLESYLVFEDDAIFADDFEIGYKRFCDEVPGDWQQIYLGGQLLHEDSGPPQKLSEWVYTPYNVNRTHCFGVHKRGYAPIYKHLMNFPYQPGEHIDHHLGRLHETAKIAVYCPKRWLVGQDGGASNISGKVNDPTFWNSAEGFDKDHQLFSEPVCVFLEGPIELAKDMQVIGWHQGNWKNDDGLDMGVCDSLATITPEVGLAKWYEYIRREVIRQRKGIPCLFHPALSWEFVSKLPFAKWYHVKAASVEEARNKLGSAIHAGAN